MILSIFSVVYNLKNSFHTYFTIKIKLNIMKMIFHKGIFGKMDTAFGTIEYFAISFWGRMFWAYNLQSRNF